MTITASAPGTLMISGEHAVLHGRRALVGAVDRRVRVALTPLADDRIVIRSSLGEREMTRQTIDAAPPFSFVGGALAAHAERMPTGCEITIEADVPHDVGLGSSAAVTVALLAALRSWIDGADAAPDALMQEAVALIRSVQGLGSGADVAASVFGGIVLYRMGPEVLQHVAVLPDIALCYVGYKTPTPEVVRRVEAERRRAPERFEALFDRFDEITEVAAVALRDRDWMALGHALNEGQTVMMELGVSDTALEGLVAQLREAPGMCGAKISGSGLGDCVLAIGQLDDPLPPSCRQIRARLCAQGVTIE